jgi:hypothetical protein
MAPCLIQARLFFATKVARAKIALETKVKAISVGIGSVGWHKAPQLFL